MKPSLKQVFDSIDCGFMYPDFYTAMAKRLPSGSRIVEVGSYKGKSLVFLLMQAQRYEKKFEIIGIDSFAGVREFPDNDLVGEFYEKMNPVLDRITFIEGESTAVAKRFQNKSCDLVFIDANHLYEHVIRDIHAWLPKVKKGGIISGHDYSSTYCGVIEAVSEVFGNAINKDYLHEYCWMYENNT